MKVLAAMSGGVDSAVAAARAVESGHEVVGVHLALSRMPGTLRITLGHSTKDSDIDAFMKAFPKAYEGAKKAGLTRR